MDKSFEELLYELRKEHEISRSELVEKIGMINIKEKNIRKWESGLEYPDINVLYKLSEIYEIPCEELLESKQLTLEAGLNGIHVWVIKVISFLLGISIYATIWLARIFMGGILIMIFLFFWIIQ